MNKHLLPALLALSSFCGAQANPITPIAARQKAMAFWKKTVGMQRHLKASYATTTQQPYYIFNDEEKGFVIIAGDDAAPTVLGYSERGTISEDSIPDALRALLQSYRQQIEYAQSQGTASPLAEEGESPVASKQLTTAEWGQTGYFNQFTPSKAPTGCVATALAIIMKYHGYPAHPQGRTIYYSDYAKKYLSADFSKSSYDFDAMPMKAQGFSATQMKGAARLMSDIGIAVSMNYGASGSAAVNSNVPKALKAYFNYSPEVQLRSASSYTNDEWLAMVRQEIDNDCPVFYTGDENGGSHAFVVDGYKGDLFSINWGWDGTYNGYYAIGSVIPQGASTKYNENVAALFNLHPWTGSRTDALLTTEEAGTLADQAADLDGKYIDTLTVKGPLNMNDINALKRINALHVDAKDAQIVTFNNYYEGNTIFDMAFYGYKNVWSMVCPRDVTSVGRDGFRASEDLNAVTLPEGVTSISDKAFAGCSRLLDITILSETPPTLGTDVFESCPCPEQGKLHVPAGKRNAYKRAAGWRNFKTIVENADPGIYTGIAKPTETSSQLTVTVQGNNLTVHTSQPVSIFDASGRLVSTSHSCTLGKGIYAVWTCGQSAKVVIP